VSDRFTTQLRHWKRRKTRLGDAAVGRIGESHVDQGERITKYFEQVLNGGFYEHGLDFGCGWGRFSELLASHCGHLWVADIFKDWVLRAEYADAVVSPIVMQSQKLPLDTGSMDLVVDIMTIQSIDNDSLAREAMHELRRVARSGATVISLHVVKPKSPTRTPAQRALHLGVSNWSGKIVTDIDRSGEEYGY
jgi:ubiquinone/menaquinone biosynthesis C-methylase UbiE